MNGNGCFWDVKKTFERDTLISLFKQITFFEKMFQGRWNRYRQEFRAKNPEKLSAQSY